MNTNEEIKSRLDIVDVIREYIPNLKAVGVNFVAPSPFKREKNPSFVVSPEKQIWHCFSTDKGGDIFTFVMEMENINFVEALRILAQKAGVTLRRENVKEQSQRNKLLDIMEDAVTFYNQKLTNAQESQSARNYLKQRGLSDKTIMDWQIGYSLESWNDLLDYLKQKDYSDQEIFMAGLSAKKEGKNNYYNRFRDRIMFPINDVNGHVVAFTARLTPEKESEAMMGKYVNSPETLIYHKSKILFGLDKAKLAIKENNFTILVEGQMDVITASQAGFKNVVASSGTALTEEQLKLLKRYSPNIALAFDMDDAGQAAADKGIDTALALEMNIKVVTLEDGKDPDELIKKDPQAFKEAIRGAKHIMEYYFEKTFKDLNLERIENIEKSKKILLPVIDKFRSNVEQDFWLKKLAEKININELSLREDLKNIKNVKSNIKTIRKQDQVREANEEISYKKTREEILSENLLALMIRFPVFFEYIIERITIDHIFGQVSKMFYKNLIIYYNNINSGTSSFKEEEEQKFSYNNLKVWLNTQEEDSRQNQLKLLDKLVVLGDKDFFELEQSEAKNEIIKTEIALKQGFFKQRRREIEKLIKKSELEGDNEKANIFLEELKSLIDESKKNSDQG